MSIAKVIEISAESPDGFEAAVDLAIDRAKDTIENIQSAWVKEQQVTVRDGAVASYRVNLKVTFLVN